MTGSRRDFPQPDSTPAFLVANHGPPLAVASLVALAIYLTERTLHGWHGPRLHLNLFLAWVPYLAALLAAASQRRPPSPLAWLGYWGGLLTWLLFFPNAPYLLTDFAYLDWSHYDLWQRVAIFAAFSQCGLMLAVASLLVMHRVLVRRSGPAAAALLVGVAIALSGFGVYVGRFLRWNSWDLFEHPASLIVNIMIRADSPVQGIRPAVFSIMLTLILATYYWFAVSLQQSGATASRDVT